MTTETEIYLCQKEKSRNPWMNTYPHRCFFPCNCTYYMYGRFDASPKQHWQCLAFMSVIQRYYVPQCLPLLTNRGYCCLIVFFYVTVQTSWLPITCHIIRHCMDLIIDNHVAWPWTMGSEWDQHDFLWITAACTYWVWFHLLTHQIQHIKTASSMYGRIDIPLSSHLDNR